MARTGTVTVRGMVFYVGITVEAPIVGFLTLRRTHESVDLGRRFSEYQKGWSLHFHVFVGVVCFLFVLPRCRRLVILKYVEHIIVYMKDGKSVKRALGT